MTPNGVNAAGAMAHSIITIITTTIVLGLYFFPALLATLSRHRLLVQIWLINGFLGWTVIGWIGALARTLIPAKGSPPAATRNLRGLGMAFAIFAVLGIMAGLALHTPGFQTIKTLMATASSPLAPPKAVAIRAPLKLKVKWTYSDQRDETRGTTIQLADLDSDNRLRFDAPYTGGVTRLTLVREMGRPEVSRLDAYLNVDGRFDCAWQDGGMVAVKFDDDPAVNFPCSISDIDASGVLFIKNTETFIARLKTAKHLSIDAPFYDRIHRQIEFSTVGLQF